MRYSQDYIIDKIVRYEILNKKYTTELKKLNYVSGNKRK
jgi:hypothetical protein